MKDIAMGVETEFHIDYASGNFPKEVRWLRNYNGSYFHKLAGELIVLGNLRGTYGIRSFISKGQTGLAATLLYNGGILYRDSGHLEYATPEFSGLDDGVAFIEAGRRIVASLVALYDTLYSKNNGAPRVRRHIVYADNADHFTKDGESICFGTHENYSGGKDTEIPDLLPFLVTRGIFCDPGYFLCGRLRDQFKSDMVLSARSLAAKEGKPHMVEFGRTPGATIKPDNPKHKQFRLHVSFGSENMHPVTNKLKFGTTALSHQLVKSPWFHYNNLCLPRISNQDGVRALWKLNNLPAHSGNARWEIRLGRETFSALEIQRRYLTLANKFFAGRDEDTDWTLEWWSKSLDALERDDEHAFWIEWLLKKRLLVDLNRSLWLEEDLAKVDMSYHRVSGGETVRDLVKKRYLGSIDYDAPEHQIQYATFNPPLDTRAWYRGTMAQALGRDLSNYISVRMLDWSTLSLERTGVYNSGIFDMPNPLGKYDESFFRFMKSIKSFLF